jgi:hypothetical protein
VGEGARAGRRADGLPEVLETVEFDEQLRVEAIKVYHLHPGVLAKIVEATRAVGPAS